MILVQDSFEAGQLIPLHGFHATRSDLKAADRPNNKRLAICKSLCRSEEQDASQFKKVRKDNITRMRFLLHNSANFKTITQTSYFIPTRQNTEESIAYV